jgi:hypothetical protein
MSNQAKRWLADAGLPLQQRRLDDALTTNTVLRAWDLCILLTVMIILCCSASLLSSLGPCQSLVSIFILNLQRKAKN